MVNIIKQKTAVLALNKSTCYVLAVFIFAAIIFYVYFANSTVRTLTVLEKTKTQLQTLKIDVSEMESKRLALENDINTEKALRAGFVQVNNPIFIMKGSQNPALSLKIN